MSYVMIFIAAIFVNNIVLSQFLGICPFLGVSKKISTALGMGFAVMFVMTISAIATHLIYYQLLVPNRLTFMITVVFILVIAALVQMVEIIMHKTSPLLYQALGIFLPLITTNCAVLGVAILAIQKDFGLLSAVCYSLANAMGFTLAIVLFAGIRERLSAAPIPKALQGVPIALITAALLSMAFMGFSGISR
ncbi:MAG: electron transport complex subunit RsxA [Azospirillum sp.]|jgi:electron transport complex, rnfABCDGE type, A subunit|nr:electron transport complex subunit RsxA [Azospirillum sp.]